MTSPLIDDALVEMVKTGIVNAHGYEIMSDFEAARIARAALTVAVPVIAGKCADIAADYEPASYVPQVVGATYYDGACEAAAEIDDAIRSLTKDTTP